MDKTNEVDKFFAELPSSDKKEADIFNDKPVAEEKKEDVVPAKEEHKNRRHRRLEQQLQEEREARIAAESRAQALSESDKFTRDTATGNVPAEWIQIYGDTPETRKAWLLNEKLLNDYSAKAKEEAVQEIESRAQESVKQQKEFETFIDSELEAIEDEYNVDVTSDSPQARKQRREFLELVQKLSPKDEEGTITGYADFTGTWEMYQAQKEEKVDNSRAKEVAARSMVKPGSVSAQPKQPTAGFDGWRKDFGLE